MEHVMIGHGRINKRKEFHYMMFRNMEVMPLSLLDKRERVLRIFLKLE
jgi:hypothetical protein